MLFGLSALVALLALPASGALSANGTQTYIVQLTDHPAVVYEGGISGYPATEAGEGPEDRSEQRKCHPVPRLSQREARAGATEGGQPAEALRLRVRIQRLRGGSHQGQADRLKTQKGVVAVTPDSTDLLDTFTTPNFLGFDWPTGYYETTGAVGEGVVIGVLDTRFNPENPAYSDRTGVNPNDKSGKLDYQQLPGWHGKCTPGEAFNASMCNQKVIGAQYFIAGALAGGGVPDFEFISPRDFDGHGSHTSTTAGGNFATPTDGDARAAGLTAINGIAPRARLSIYKVCWSCPIPAPPRGPRLSARQQPTRPSRTASMSSIIPLERRQPISSIECRSRSSTQPPPGCSLRPRPATRVPGASTVASPFSGRRRSRRAHTTGPESAR